MDRQLLRHKVIKTNTCDDITKIVHFGIYVAGMSLEKLFDMCRIYEISAVSLFMFTFSSSCLCPVLPVSVLYVEKIIT